MLSTSSQSQGLLLFKLSTSQSFAIGTLKIQELVPYQALTKMPNTNQCILGVTHIRGTTLPIIDMAASVGYHAIPMTEYKDCTIIITDCSRQHVGFLVRKIERIIECNWRNIDPPPDTLGSKTYITGVTEFDNIMIQLLDIELLLSEIYQSTDEQDIKISALDKGLLQHSRILLVDDSAVARHQLEKALTNIDIPFKVCKNSKDALDVMKQAAEKEEPIDILVSDIEMPGLDGYELAFEVRNTKNIAKAYIILHSSLSSKMCIDKASQVGANIALTKFDAQSLIDAMLKGTRKAQ